MFKEIVPEKILIEDMNSGILIIKHTEYPGGGNDVLNKGSVEVFLNIQKNIFFKIKCMYTYLN